MSKIHSNKNTKSGNTFKKCSDFICLKVPSPEPNIIYSSMSSILTSALTVSGGTKNPIMYLEQTEPNKSTVNTSSSTVCFNDNFINICNSLPYKNDSLKTKLYNLISKYNVSHNFVNKFLIILRSEGLDLPKDSITFLNTPQMHIVNIASGSYIHIGIEFMMKPILSTAYHGSFKRATTLMLYSFMDSATPRTKVISLSFNYAYRYPIKPFPYPFLALRRK